MSVDLYDMDNKTHVRHNSESSNASTSGYSTMSPYGVDLGNISPSSSTVSMSSTSVGSPRTAILQSDFSNLNLPSPNTTSYQHYQQSAISDLSYRQILPTTTAVAHSGINYSNQIYTNIPNLSLGDNGSFMPNYSVQMDNNYGGIQPMDIGQLQNSRNASTKRVYPAKLQITEQPVDKFRFRYKSEMHGTHGSLTSSTSNRTSKRYPEVTLLNYNGPAKIRCSLFQANLDSPHSHQLVVRKDEIDICDPHELDVGPEQGFVAQFQNMGIIHTAKKYITNELFEKKQKRLLSQLGGSLISERQRQELYKETEKEAKAMNLNQVRLCFEAFREEPNKSLTPIAAPVYTNAINNRKSAQTGDLRIVRLSIATGSVSGKDELILLVEKVSKKNIKVRFYELNESGDELLWEAYGIFRESDVHHQYAIVCQTPTYKDKNIDKPVDVLIELVRPSDDERSHPLPFRYKPLDTVISRKRRRTCSSANSSNNSSNNSFNSFELPETVAEQQANMNMSTMTDQISRNDLTISEEFNIRDALIANSEELAKYVFPSINSFETALLETDGTSVTDKKQIVKPLKSKAGNAFLEKIFKMHAQLFNGKTVPTDIQRKNAAVTVSNIYREHAESNDNETLIHEIIISDDNISCIKLFQILNQLKLVDLFNTVLNGNNESGLHCACLYNHHKYIHALLANGCDPNIPDKHGNTAMHIAVREKYKKCVESFLNFQYKDAHKKLNIRKKNYEDLTPLHLAIKLDYTEIAKMLLNYDGGAANVRISKDGNNALHMAIETQNRDIVDAILKARNIGNTLNERNNAGKLPIDLAKENYDRGDRKILGLLMPLYTDIDIEERDVFKIKEEDLSSTSASDEEDLNDEQLTIDEVKSENEPDVESEKPDIKTESCQEEYIMEDNSNQIVEELELLLKNSVKYSKLAKIINEDNKWKKLATISHMSQLICLWSNAEDMLEYIKNRSSNIEFSAFANAIAEDLQLLS